MRLVRKFAAGVRLLFADPGSLFLTVRMAAWVFALTIIAPLVPLPTMLRIASTKRRASRRRSGEELARGIDRVFHAGLFRDGTCWKRSAVLHRYLQMTDVETDIIYGVRKSSDGKLAAHAWLERDGHPYLEREPPDYTEAFRYPPKRS